MFIACITLTNPCEQSKLTMFTLFSAAYHSDFCNWIQKMHIFVSVKHWKYYIFTGNNGA